MTTRYLTDTHDITGILSTVYAGTTTLAPLSSSTSIEVICTHETTGAEVVIPATDDAISGSETGAYTAACSAATFSAAGRYARRVVVEWGVESRTYPDVALTVLE